MTNPDGTPAQGWAGIVAVVQTAGEMPPGSTGLDAGRYTLDHLGPYDWQLFVNASGQAAQFSGGVGNRMLAQSARVRSGRTTYYAFRLREGVRVTTTITGLQRPYPGVRVYNAATGDLLAHARSDPFTAMFPLIGPQWVRVVIEDGDFLRRTGGPIWIPASGDKNITLHM